MKKRLVVIVPGLSGRYRYWQPLCERLQQEGDYGLDETKWLGFEHKIWLLSIGRLDSPANKLKSRIDAEWTLAGGFEEIILVGHSLGGLIVRQAFLLARGAAGDEDACEWSSKVCRIVLLASLNRGIDPKRRIDHRLLTRLLTWIYRLFPFLPYPITLDAVTGSAFLANLRINWIRLFQRYVSDGEATSPNPLPQVVQVLGDTDGLVHASDSRDVLAFPHGHYLSVPNADHAQIYRLDTTSEPELRYAKLRQAFLDSFPVAAKIDDGKPTVRRVVFLLHGIRASNVDTWIQQLEVLIEARDGEKTVVRRPTYGYFTALRFALPSVRRKNVAVFQDWYTETLAEFPNADFSIIAHSNGTYMLGQALASLPGMRFKNVVLAGSVLPQDFWADGGERRSQVERIRNERANRDWPVALLCSALRGLLMKDVGTAGFAGFLGSETFEVAYYAGGHGAALAPANQSRLVDFVSDRALEEPTDLKAGPGYFRQLSNLMPYLAWVSVSAGSAALALWIFQDWVFHPRRAIAAAVGLLFAYVILDIL
jgi:pimeloyl-ACP methyl ester carboxylesterase